MIFSHVNAVCDDAPADGVDYSNCQFSEGQDLSSAYIPNSNLSFISFIKVILDKSVMMNSTLANGNFAESSFVRANLYESNFEGANLNNTIWIDGMKCDLGSIGKCIKWMKWLIKILIKNEKKFI